MNTTSKALPVQLFQHPAPGKAPPTLRQKLQRAFWDALEVYFDSNVGGPPVVDVAFVEDPVVRNTWAIQAMVGDPLPMHFLVVNKPAAEVLAADADELANELCDVEFTSWPPHRSPPMSAGHFEHPDVAKG